MNNFPLMVIIMSILLSGQWSALLYHSLEWQILSPWIFCPFIGILCFIVIPLGSVILFCAIAQQYDDSVGGVVGLYIVISSGLSMGIGAFILISRINSSITLTGLKMASNHGLITEFINNFSL